MLVVADGMGSTLAIVMDINLAGRHKSGGKIFDCERFHKTVGKTDQNNEIRRVCTRPTAELRAGNRV